VGISPAPRTIRPLAARITAALLAALLFLTLPSCADTPTTPPETPKSQAKAAYEDYRDMVKRLLESPDPADPEIARRATGGNQEFLVGQLTNLTAAGQALRFGPNYEFEVLSTEVTDAEAVVRDCTVDDAETIDVRSGDVVTAGTTTELLEATMQLISGDWRVSKIERLGHWDGAVECEE
jgi:hypothetical protein